MYVHVAAEEVLGLEGGGIAAADGAAVMAVAVFVDFTIRVAVGIG